MLGFWWRLTQKTKARKEQKKVVREKLRKDRKEWYDYATWPNIWLHIALGTMKSCSTASVMPCLGDFGSWELTRFGGTRKAWRVYPDPFRRIWKVICNKKDKIAWTCEKETCTNYKRWTIYWYTCDFTMAKKARMRCAQEWLVWCPLRGTSSSPNSIRNKFKQLLGTCEHCHPKYFILSWCQLLKNAAKHRLMFFFRRRPRFLVHEPKCDKYIQVPSRILRDSTKQWHELKWAIYWTIV